MGLFEILKGEQPGIIKTVLNYENAGQFGEYSTEYALTNHNLPGELVILKNITVGGSSAAQTSLIGHNLCKTEKSTTSITRFAKTRRISKHFPRI